MMVATRGSVLGILAWQWRKAVLFGGAALLTWLLRAAGHFDGLALPPLPLAVVGGAIGIFVSFRTNSCYARWWEGRQLWGRLINMSRHLASQVVASLPEEHAHDVVWRQIAFAHALRCALRKQDTFADEHFVAAAKESASTLKHEKNLPYALLDLQHKALAESVRRGEVSEQRMTSFDSTLAALIDVQGGCERLKNTPFPRGYAFISDRLILAYGLLFPLAMVREMGAMIVPLNLLVCGAFTLISEAGRVLEDPFDMYWNGLPLSAMSITIEVNLRQRLGDAELPAIPVPNEKGVLM
jgi:ion channel-forming bestrophin family protein